jgi:hypothetical protein
VFAEEVTVATAVSRAGKGSRVAKRLRKVNLNEVPARSECVSRSVGNEKEAIRRGLDGSVKISSSKQRDRNGRVVVGKNWDSGVSWDESDGRRKGRRRRRRRVRIRNISERNGIRQRHSNGIVTGDGSVSGLACSRQSGMHLRVGFDAYIRNCCVFAS